MWKINGGKNLALEKISRGEARGWCECGTICRVPRGVQLWLGAVVAVWLQVKRGAALWWLQRVCMTPGFLDYHTIVGGERGAVEREEGSREREE